MGRAIRAAVLVSWPWLLIASDAVKWMPFFTRLREKKHRILLSPSVSAVNDGIGCLSDSFFSSCFQSVDSSSNVSLSFWYNCNCLGCSYKLLEELEKIGIFFLFNSFIRYLSY